VSWRHEPHCRLPASFTLALSAGFRLTDCMLQSMTSAATQAQVSLSNPGRFWSPFDDKLYMCGEPAGKQLRYSH